MFRAEQVLEERVLDALGPHEVFALFGVRHIVVGNRPVLLHAVDMPV